MKYVITIHPPAGKAYGGGVRPNLAQFHLDEKLALNSPLANTIIFNITNLKMWFSFRWK